MMFQDFRLFEDKTVYENLAFAMRVVGARPSEIKQRVPHVLSLVGLAHRAKSLPGKMSDGEKQRVAIARALINNPDVIIADEPTGNVDPEMSKALFDLFMRINKLGKTVIVVTHDHNMVNYYNERVITIDGGHIVSDVPAKKAPEAETESNVGGAE
jgi:cell division transport system ATP-binding protein